MSKPKMYFVCDGKPDWISAWGVLDNGFCFGQHVCSDYGFAPGDLYFRRKERIAALKEIFGHEWTRDETELVIVTTPSEIPSWWHAQEAMQEGLKPLYDRYNALISPPSEVSPKETKE